MNLGNVFEQERVHGLAIGRVPLSVHDENKRSFVNDFHRGRIKNFKNGRKY